MLNGAWYCGLDVRAKVRFTEARGSSDVGGSRVLFRKEQSRSGQASSVDPSVRVTDEIGELAGERRVVQVLELSALAVVVVVVVVEVVVHRVRFTQSRA